MEWNSARQNRIERDGMEQNWMEFNRAGQNGIELDILKYS